MRNFPLYELDWQEFEKLVVTICDKILGIGTINFSPGKDGGRDAKFNGKAENFPSKASPWEGRFIIQAKHTDNPIAKCSDAEFKNKLDNEVSNRLRKLVDNHELNYYLVFTNRKLSGITDSRISYFINTNLKVENQIIGEEKIQHWLKEYPEIPKVHNLNKLFIPLDFYEKDLKEIIIAFSKMRTELGAAALKKIEQLKNTDKTTKNELNKLGKEYFDIIRKNSLSYFVDIETFLKDPLNKEYLNFYKNTISDLQAEITIKREEYNNFEEILEELYKYVLSRNLDFKDNRKLIRVFLHYMYWHCDIGKGE